MARLTLILGVLATVIYLLDGYRFLLNEWRNWRNKGKWLVVLMIGLCSCDGLPSVAEAVCDTTLNPGDNVATTVEAAASGSTICLNSGGYGTVNLGTFTKSPRVTVISVTPLGASMSMNAQSGANGVTFDGLTFDGGNVSISGSTTKNLTIQNSAFGTNQLDISTINFNNNNILVDHNTFGAFDNVSGCEGRLCVHWGGGPGTVPAGVVVTNNTFGPGGCSDGIQIGSYGVVVGPGNVFTGLRQGTCGPHVDAIQGYGQSHSTITGNYFIGNTIDIGFYDGGNVETVTNNVFGPPGDAAQNLQLTVTGMTFAHNTFRDTLISSGAKFGNPVNTGWVVENNVFVNSDFTAGGDQPGCGADCIMRYNLLDATSSTDPAGTNGISGSPTFIGGATPTTYAGHQLTSASLGYRAGNDGNDMGVVYDTNTPAVIARVLRWMEVAAFVTGMGWHFRKPLLAVCLAAFSLSGTLVQLAPRSYETLKGVSYDSSVKVLTVFNHITKQKG